MKRPINISADNWEQLQQWRSRQAKNISPKVAVDRILARYFAVQNRCAALRWLSKEDQ